MDGLSEQGESLLGLCPVGGQTHDRPQGRYLDVLAVGQRQIACSAWHWELRAKPSMHRW